MGLDYIRSLTGKPWLKRWNKGLNKLKLPTLFDVAVNENSSAVTAHLSPNAHAKVGDVFTVEVKGDCLNVTNGLRQIAQVANAPQEICTSIMAKSGVAEGVVDHVGLFGDTVKLTIK